MVWTAHDRLLIMVVEDHILISREYPHQRPCVEPRCTLHLPCSPLLCSEWNPNEALGTPLADNDHGTIDTILECRARSLQRDVLNTFPGRDDRSPECTSFLPLSKKQGRPHLMETRSFPRLSRPLPAFRGLSLLKRPRERTEPVHPRHGVYSGGTLFSSRQLCQYLGPAGSIA